MPRQILVGLLLLLVSQAREKNENDRCNLERPDLRRANGKNYCAACRGIDGKSDAAAADILKAWPLDLTMLTQRYNAEYPADHVVATLRQPCSYQASGNTARTVACPMFRVRDCSSHAISEGHVTTQPSKQGLSPVVLNPHSGGGLEGGFRSH